MRTHSFGASLCRLSIVTAALTLSASQARAADIMKQIIAEVDPEAPAAAAYDQSTTGVATSMYGANVDFNMGGMLSTGPEFWMGSFVVNGPSNASTPYLRQDLYPGESERFDAIRLRWMFTAWEEPQSMRGWYVKGGYSYTRINSRANMIPQTAGQGNTPPQLADSSAAATNTSLIIDTRHGVVAGFGNRWLFASQKLSVSLGASITGTFRRSVEVDGTDPNALTNYNNMINTTLQDTHMTTKPLPEADLALGYAW